MDNTPVLNPFDQDEKSAWKPIIWLSLAAVALVCCFLLAAALFFFQSDLGSLVSQYSLTSTPTPNLAATANLIQTRTIGAVDQWPVSLSETFDNNNYDWYVGTYDDGMAKLTYAVKDGKYQWQVDTHQGSVEWVELGPDLLIDFYVTVEMEGTGRTLSWDHGIIFRQDSEGDFYYFGITPNRGFFVSVSHKQQWKTLVPFSVSSAIHLKGPNRLAIFAQGPHFVFLINDQFVAETTNDQIKQGKLALGVQLYNADDQTTYQFDNIEVRIPGPSVTSTATLAVSLTPSLTPTPHVLIPPQNGESLLDETFDSNALGWDAYYSSGSKVSVHDGKLYVTSESAGFVGLVICRGCPAPRNAFYYQAELVPSEQTELPHGLAFCLSPNMNEYYAFEVNSVNGSYALYKSKPGNWTTLVENTPSNAVNKYPLSNTLGILYDQGDLKLYINGIFVTSFQDEKPLACEQFGIFIDGGAAEVIVDNMYEYEINAAPTETSTP